MRCFTACFGTNSNHKKIIIKPCSTSTTSSKKINSISPQALQDLLKTHGNDEAFVAAINDKKEEARHKIVIPINLFEESKDEEEEEKLNKSNRKNLLETRENVEDIVSIYATKEESKKKEGDELNRSGRKKVTYDPSVSADCLEINPSNLQKQNGEEKEEVKELSNSTVSSYISYPPNHNDDANNNDENGLVIQEESSSLFSLSLDSTRRGNNPMPKMSDNEEVNSPLKQSVNLSVLKEAGVTTPPSLLKKQGKENKDTNLVDFSITYKQGIQEEDSNLKHQKKEVAVDTSLSSWLVESSQDDTPNSKNSAASVRNSRVRQILGALKVEEFKDEKHIVIGTVGSYLRHTGQATAISSC